MEKEEKVEERCIISVLGESKITTPPDYVCLWFTIKKVSSTINESQIEVTKSVNKILGILKEYDVKDIKTNYIDIRQAPDWELDKNSEKNNIDKMVKQSISANIYELEKNIDNLKNILDKITIENNDFEIMVSFKTKNLDKLAIEIRELAYKNALEKAIHYAKMANLSIIKTNKISEFPPSEKTNMWFSSTEKSSNNYFEDNAQMNIPVGYLEFDIKLYCDFLAE